MNNPNLFDNLMQKKKTKESIKKRLTSYIEQLKIHFNVSDDDINAIIKGVVKSRSKSFFNFY